MRRCVGLGWDTATAGSQGSHSPGPYLWDTAGTNAPRGPLQLRRGCPFQTVKMRGAGGLENRFEGRDLMLKLVQEQIAREKDGETDLPRPLF